MPHCLAMFLKVFSTTQVIQDPADAKTLGLAGKSVGQPGPAMEKRNVFSLFRMFLKRQGGQSALQALVKQVETEGAAAEVGTAPRAAAEGVLDAYEVQLLLKKVIQWQRIWSDACNNCEENFTLRRSGNLTGHIRRLEPRGADVCRHG